MLACYHHLYDVMFHEKNALIVKNTSGVYWFETKFKFLRLCSMRNNRQGPDSNVFNVYAWTWSYVINSYIVSL